MRKVIYTALFSDYEELKEPTVLSPGWEYVCFTDQPLQSKVWQIIQKPLINNDPQRTARYYKLMGWHEWENSLWLDAAFQINMDINLLWNNYFRPPFTAPKHPIRTCIYNEIDSCIANNRGETSKLLIQKDIYLKANVPRFGNNIITSGVLMRQRTESVIELCKLWWDELSLHSVRDQVAFAKVSIGHEFHTFNWDYSQSKELKYIKHYKHRN